MSPSRKREAVDHLESSFSVSERRACRVLSQPRSSHRYERQPTCDEGRLLSRIHELVLQHPRFGYRRITVLLQRVGFEAGFDRVYRLWRREGLKVQKKATKEATSRCQCESLQSRSCGAEEPCLGVGFHLRSNVERDQPEVVERGR